MDTLGAADFGVPQERRRVILVAAAPGCKLPATPSPRGPRSVFRDLLSDLPQIANESLSAAGRAYAEAPHTPLQART